MIAKIIKGTSFSGVIIYMLGKREGMARILDGEGVRVDATSNEIAGDFNLQASMRPNIKKPVCHTSSVFPPKTVSDWMTIRWLILHGNT